MIKGKGGISAKVITHSIANGIPICTMELRYPRFIHAEFMTHRMFSRNASSSRAIPVARMLEQVENDPALPVHWGKNQPGMQAREELLGNDLLDAEYDWIEGSKFAAVVANNLLQANLHKQISNRVLEPFQFITVVVTATEWDNFFALRLHEDAQPEIYELARVMKEAMDNSAPIPLGVGEWHAPYTDDDWDLDNDQAIKCSVARCARVSYLNHDGTECTVERDAALYDQLLEAGHMSPMEHIATPMNMTSCSSYLSLEHGMTHLDSEGNLWSGNLRGWVQHRQTL